MNFKQFYNEEKDGINFVVSYPGRYHPFHKNHYETFSNIVKIFGKDNVYILTSNKVEELKSPFNFKE